MPPECKTSVRDLEPYIKLSYGGGHCLQVSPSLDQFKFTILHRNAADTWWC